MSLLNLEDSHIDESSSPLDSSSFDMENRLENLVRRRLENLRYMVKVHQGGVHWMNVVSLEKADILQAYGGNPEKTIEKWATLGLGIGELLSRSINGATLVRAISQLLIEFDYHFSNAAGRGIKLMLAKDSEYYPDSSSRFDSKPVLHRCGKYVTYEYLVGLSLIHI